MYVSLYFGFEENVLHVRYIGAILLTIFDKCHLSKSKEIKDFFALGSNPLVPTIFLYSESSGDISLFSIAIFIK